MRHKVTAVRSYDQTPATPAHAARALVDSAPATVESLGRQLKDALALRRMQSISVWDAEGSVQWLNEGALGPDEHALMVDGFDQLSANKSLTIHESGLEDGRYALFLPVRTPSGTAVGLVMVLTDVKSMGEGAQERVAAPAVRAIMQRLAVLMKPAGLSTTSVPSLAILELAESATPPMAPNPTPAAVVPAAVASGSDAASGISPQEVHDLLEFELPPEVPPVRSAPAAVAAATTTPSLQDDPPAPDETAEEPHDALLLDFIPAPPVLRAAPVNPPPVTKAAPAVSAAPVRPAPSASTASRVSAAVQRARTIQPQTPTPPVIPATAAPLAAAGVVTAGESQLILEVVQFGKLRAGGQSRRFQVQARTTATDALILQRLVTWLAAHRSGWSSQPTSFTVNLSIATLEDERFVQRMAGTLNNNGLSPEVLGFEITEALCTQRRALVERFITQCEKAGSWVVVDDFSFDSQVLPLLRSKAVRLVKLDHKLTANALKDKLSQALVIATVQAVKVLGIHCAAKRIESQAALQWLTAIGCDFAQGSALSQPQLMDILLRAPAPA